MKNSAARGPLLVKINNGSFGTGLLTKYDILEQQKVVMPSHIFSPRGTGFCCSLHLCTAFADMTSEKRALESAQLWLTAVDDGRYAESWETAAVYFRNAVSREQWKRSLNSVRKPLGKDINRSVKTKQYTTSLPGAPDGKYVVIQFETSFANKKASVET